MASAPDETTRLLSAGQDGVNPREGRSGVLDKKVAWWKKQSPWWALIVAPLLAATMGIVLAPKIEVYTGLACMAHRPEWFPDELELGLGKVVGALGALPRRCETDPEIRRVVAKLTAAETTILGILSCLTTGWWASLSDRTGRRTLFFVSAFGALSANTIYILVNHYWRILPGGYWSILLGPIMEGSLGGMPAALVAFTSYVGDTTPERHRILALNFGLYWTGMSLGPVLGNVALRYTQNILSIFYVAVTLQITFLLYTRLFMLEPLSKEQQNQARANWRMHHEQERLAPERKGLVARLWSPFSPIFMPLSAIMPRVKRVRVNGLERLRRDWNLFLAAIGFGSLFIIAGDLPFKFQYAAGAFGWTAEENGVFLSVLSATRGVYLTIILPFIIKLLKPPTREVEVKMESDTEPSGFKVVKHKLESPTFDLRLARISIFLEGTVHIVMLLFPSPASLYFLGVVGTCGAGFPPAMQSVILSLYIQDGGEEIGKVFGALGVIQTLCAQIISPMLYGFIYVATVTFFPMSIFVVSLTAIMTAFSIVCLVRMPSNKELITRYSGVPMDVSHSEAIRTESGGQPLVDI